MTIKSQAFLLHYEEKKIFQEYCEINLCINFSGWRKHNIQPNVCATWRKIIIDYVKYILRETLWSDENVFDGNLMEKSWQFGLSLLLELINFRH